MQEKKYKSKSTKHKFILSYAYSLDKNLAFSKEIGLICGFFAPDLAPYTPISFYLKFRKAVLMYFYSSCADQGSIDKLSVNFGKLKQPQSM
jgi:hypothetical protein